MNLNFISVDKPAGISTHSPDRARKPWDGVVERLQTHLGRKLWPCHRLDRETSGVLWVADNEETAREISLCFARREVQKTYFFVAKNSSELAPHVLVRSQIEQNDKIWTSKKVSVEPLNLPLPPSDSHKDAESSVPNVSDALGFALPPSLRDSLALKSTPKVDMSMDSSRPSPGEALTYFSIVKSEGEFSLWRAEPLTGRTHQIRLHARDLGVPIVGDSLYGGIPFSHLLLHCAGMQLKIHEKHLASASPLPRVMADLKLLERPLLARWLLNFERRERWSRTLGIPLSPQRWLHQESDPLRMDQLGSVGWLSWFGETTPSPSEWNDIKDFLKITHVHCWQLNLRQDRGQNPNLQTTFSSDPEVPENWEIEEDGLKYEMRRSQGLSPGLFLDSRANRRWVQQNAKGRSVLNLFSYTGGFSLAAVRGEASSICTVDLSKNFIEWSKFNFKLNGFDPDSFEFRIMDTIDYLDFARRKFRKYDLIVCDPPSFARRPKGVFRLADRDQEMIKAMAALLHPGGHLLFSTNYEGWTAEFFVRRMSQYAKELSLKFIAPPAPDLDFEFPRESAILKTAFFQL